MLNKIEHFKHFHILHADKYIYDLPDTLFKKVLLPILVFNYSFSIFVMSV